MIKSIIATLFVCSAVSVQAQGLYPVTTPAPVEIQVFIDYRGFDNYAYKYVSTPERLISAGYLYPSNLPYDNGACFKGDAFAARDLFEQMVWLMNDKNKSYTEPLVTVEYDKTTYKPYLKIEAIDVYGRLIEWFPRLSECIRWSTPDERRLEPLG